MMRKLWLLVPVAALAVLAGCSSTTTDNGSTAPTTAKAAATTSTATTAAPSRLTKAQFTAALKAAGWAVGDQAYVTAVRMCASGVSDADIRHLGELADPNASDAKLAAYLNAVHKSC
jgi:beta-lactamase regulating signal transducer with metallopeptidase domain